MHTLTKEMSMLEKFSVNCLFSKEHVLSVDFKNLMSRLKNRRGGARYSDLFNEQQT